VRFTDARHPFLYNAVVVAPVILIFAAFRLTIVGLIFYVGLVAWRVFAWGEGGAKRRRFAARYGPLERWGRMEE
jgi:hypothetical protein